MKKLYGILVLGLVLSLTLTACEKKGARSADHGDDDDDEEITDTDGDGVADAEDEFPDNPLFGSLSTSIVSGEALVRQVTKMYEQRVRASRSAMEIGWCNEPSIAKENPTDSEFPVPYVDNERLDVACPNRNTGEPFCADTYAYLNDKTVTDFRMDVTVESNPDEAWMIMIRANADGTEGIAIAYDPWAHRWRKWPGGEDRPFGIFSVSSMDGYNTNDPEHPYIGYHRIGEKTFRVRQEEDVHQLTIEAIGPRITVHDNGKLVLSVEDEGESYTSGKIGFRTWMGGCMKVKTLSIADKLPTAE